MSLKVVLFVLSLVGVALSGPASLPLSQTPHSQNLQPKAQPVEQGHVSNNKPQDNGYPVYNNYRSGVSPSSNNVGPSHNQQDQYQNYPANGPRYDAYESGRELDGNPYFGLSSNAVFELSAYFGQVFWSIIAFLGAIGIGICIIRLVSGTDIVGGLVDKFRGSGAARALNLDRLTNMAHQAFEIYDQIAAVEDIQKTR